LFVCLYGNEELHTFVSSNNLRLDCTKTMNAVSIENIVQNESYHILFMIF